jgi:hypothetical protein
MTKTTGQFCATMVALAIVVSADRSESVEASDVRDTAHGKDAERASGFVFVDGQYVEAPYVVTAQDGCVIVNSVRVRKMSEWPPDRDPPEKPEIPAEVIKDATSFDDLVIKDKNDAWHGRMARWIARNIKPADREREFMVFVNSLPFVKEAIIENHVLVVTQRNGSVRKLALDFSAYSPPMSKEEVIMMVEDSAKTLQSRLDKGDTYLFFSSGLELSFGKTKSAMDLALMCEILTSDRNRESKLNILKRMAIVPESCDAQVASLFTDFRVSEQLAMRIRKLKDSIGIEPRALEQVPAVSPAEAERRALERAQQKERLRGETK